MVSPIFYLLLHDDRGHGPDCRSRGISQTHLLNKAPGGCNVISSEINSERSICLLLKTHVTFECLKETCQNLCTFNPL